MRQLQWPTEIAHSAAALQIRMNCAAERVLCRRRLASKNRLCSPDRRLQDETCAEFALRVESLQIGEHRLSRWRFDQFRMNEHRHLLDNEGAPKRMRIQIIGVSEKSFDPNILEAGGMKVASKKS
jgi:hypothetical protein